jgi:two-component system, LytTR family, sensor kinase
MGEHEQGEQVTVEKARLDRVVTALSAIAVGNWDPQLVQLPVQRRDAFGMLEAVLNLFSSEHGETLRRNREYLEVVEAAREAAMRQQVREAQLQEQLARAQLHTLRMQLQPHFLFNTLNSIAALVELDPKASQRMIERLSDFFRLTLVSSHLSEVPLREELALVGHYVDLERMRFADRLRVRVDVAPGLLEHPVPSFILQPLVENAIRHGIQPQLEGGTVEVRGWEEGGALLLEVADDGVGLPVRPDAAARPGGVGLANTRQRLAVRYGASGWALSIRPHTPRGTSVLLRLPLERRAGEGEP